ncbi:MAG: hypothetical protein ACKOB6_04365 [Candidatus Kapaibacterium sp.]
MTLRIERWIVWLVLAASAGTAASAQWWFGFGGQYIQPMKSEFDARNTGAPGLSFAMTGQHTCCWWYGVELDYSPLKRRDSAAANLQNFDHQTQIGAHLRYFPWRPDKTPLYIAGNISITDVSIADSSAIDPLPDLRNSATGALGAKLSVGYLFLFDCYGPYFFDLHLSANEPALLFRGKDRPRLSQFALGLRFAIRL